MKRINVLIIVFCLMLLFPVNVRALSGSVSLSCNKSANPGSTVTCSVRTNVDDVVTSFEANVTTSDGLSVTSFTNNDKSKWAMVGTSTDKSKINAIAEDQVTDGSFELGTLTLALASDASGDQSVTLSNIVFYDGSNHEANISDAATATISVITASSSSSSAAPSTGDSGDTSTTTTEKPVTTFVPNKLNEDSKLFLTDLVVDGYDIGFDKDTLDYILTIGEETELVITPTVNDDNVTYSILGNEDLVNGSIISIVLSNIDNAEEVVTYTISIVKEEGTEVVTTGDNGKDVDVFMIVFYIIVGVLVLINIVRIALSIKNKKSMEE